jgi:large subunit ribosomal protein L17
MRHRVSSSKLGRSSAHQKALMASLVSNLIKERRIKTTLAKAKQARSVAEKMVTLARRDSVDARRRAKLTLRQSDAVDALFADIVPLCAGREGGYTRILKLGRRASDSSEMAMLEWVGPIAATGAATEEDEPAEAKADA